MSRVAAIDCGTNSLRLLVADVDAGRLTDVVRELAVVRLGQGVDHSGRLDPDAIERTRVALVGYAETIREVGAARVRMVATSATRDAENRADFVAMVRGVLGVDPDVIEGGEEAQLSFRGAIDVIPGLRGALVADIGGGSTELVYDTDDGLVAHSYQVGCVRLTERHLHSDPPAPGQVRAMVDDVRAVVGSIAPAPVLVGVAGTVTTVAAVALGLDRYDSDVIHGARVSRALVLEVTDRLVRMSYSERAALPVMHPGRADVIVAGALILRTLLEVTGAAEVIVSEHDILDGIALELATEGLAT